MNIFDDDTPDNFNDSDGTWYDDGDDPWTVPWGDDD